MAAGQQDIVTEMVKARLRRAERGRWVSPGEVGETAQSRRGRGGHAQAPVLVSGCIGKT